MEPDDRNPLLIPGNKPTTMRRGCPVCKSPDYNGRNIQGSITYTCAKCNNKWQGGLNHEPQDPTVPTPPINPQDRPVIDFVRTKEGEVVEQRRRVNTTQEFRKGLPIPDGEE